MNLSFEINEMLERFGVKNTNELLLHKQKETQTRIFSSGKPILVKMSSDECKKLCDKAGVQYAPGYEYRVLQYIVSDERKDRYGDIVRASGATFDNYRNNPVIFFSHNYEQPPIGNSLKTWIDRSSKSVQSWGLFVDDNIDKTGFSDLIFRLAASRFMRACSVGFAPIEARVPKNEADAEKSGLGRYGVEYTKWDMLEWSPCGIPANPGALQNALKQVKSLDIRKEDFDLADKFKLFNPNVLDMFKDLTIGDNVKTFTSTGYEFGEALTIEPCEKGINSTADSELTDIASTPELERGIAPITINNSIDLSIVVEEYQKIYDLINETRNLINETKVMQKNFEELVKRNAPDKSLSELYNTEPKEKLELFSTLNI